VGLGGGLAAFRLRLWVRAACGVRRTSDARARATTAASPRTVLSSIRATRHALDTPPLNTAANPACDPPGVRAGARGREIPDEKAMMTTPAAVARPAATAATIRRSALAREMPRIVLRGRPRGTSTLGGWEDPRVPASGPDGRLGGVRRRLQRIVNRRRSLTPEVLGARWRSLAVIARWCGLGIERHNARTERHELLARTQPVAREAHHVCLRLRPGVSYLGFATFPHSRSALFQRFLRRRRECRPHDALL